MENLESFGIPEDGALAKMKAPAQNPNSELTRAMRAASRANIAHDHAAAFMLGWMACAEEKAANK